MTSVDRASLTVPPDVEHVGLARSCVRDLVEFIDSDHESRALLALTEVMVNAIEVSAPIGRQVEVQVEEHPGQRLIVTDWALGSEPDRTGHLGVGLTIASAMTALEISQHDAGTTVAIEVGVRREL